MKKLGENIDTGHYVQTGEELFQIGQNKAVRINARDTGGRPVGVYFDSDDLSLCSFHPDLRSSTGIPAAASLGISS